MTSLATLGAFTLDAPIARGTIGHVWRGHHQATGQPVAIKVMTDEALRQAHLREMFLREAQAAASLDHPNVAMLLDHGIVPDDPALCRPTGIAAASPYLVTEFASGGTLRQLRRTLSWDDVEAVLLALLDALAHAHARGVVHRDIKPSNLLLATQQDARPGVKLTDWGIAHAATWQRGKRANASAGTLHYMAPEQVRGELTDQGPWTDLYAVGCLAYRLTTGRLPFSSLRGEALARAQCETRPPPLQPRISIAAGFEAWVSCLLSKSPADRFRSAASAAEALRGLPMPTRPSWMPSTPLPEPRRVMGPSRGSTWTPTLGNGPVPIPRYRETVLPGREVPRISGIPAQWTRSSRPGATELTGGNRLGLWGLRPIPLTGRRPERDVLWQNLLRAAESHRPHLVILRGERGMGKTALARWLCLRAREVGVERVLSPVQARHETLDSAILRALQRAMGLHGLATPTVLRRLERDLPELTPPLKPDLFQPLAAAGSMLERRAARRMRRTEVMRWFRTWCSNRPSILVAEDLQEHPETAAMLRTIHHAPESHDTPLLTITSVRPSVLEQQSQLSAWIDELIADSRCTVVDILPLEPPEFRDLLGMLMDLDESTAARMAQLAHGCPQYAVQLMDEWVRHRYLTDGPHGLVLNNDATDMPADLRTLALEAMEGLVDDADEAWLTALERAATLGMDFDRGEWHVACADLWKTPEDVDAQLTRLEGQLRMRRIVQDSPEGLAFCHPMHREVLLWRAREGSRYQRHHAVIATGLAGEAGTADLDARVGWHLLESGDVVGALDRIIPRLADLRMRESSDRSRDLITRLEAAIEAHTDAIPMEHVLALRLEAVTLHRLRGDYRGALDMALELVERAGGAGEHGIDASARLEAAIAYLHTNHVDEADALLAGLLEDEKLQAHQRALALYTAAAAAGERRRHDVQDDLHRQAGEAFTKSGDMVGWADCQRDRGSRALIREQFEHARSLLLAALPIYESRGLYLGLAHTLNGLAEIDRTKGELEAAAAGYLKAKQCFDAVGAGQAVIPMLNLSLVHLDQRQFLQAEKLLTDAIRRLTRQGRRGFAAAAMTLLLCCLAHNGDWEEWDRTAHRAMTDLEDTGLISRDVAWSLELAAQLAHEAGEDARSAQARRTARHQYRSLGDEAAVERLSKPPK